MSKHYQPSIIRDNTADLSCFRSNGEVLLFNLQPNTESNNPGVMQAEKACINCKRSFNSALEICPFCGANQKFAVPVSAVVSQHYAKSRVTAAVLAIFLGGFGAHKFYLGKTGWGLLYLAFFWAYIPWIVGFFEGLLLLMMKDDQFMQKYG